MGQARAAKILGMLLALSPVRDAGAVDLQNLISPGPLLEAHAREAKECAACHEHFDRGSQNRLCLHCHEDIRGDVERREGFHGRLGQETDSECRVCHSEHKGSDADIVGLLAESFDHDRTDFALEGAHAALSCASCHPAGKRHRETDGDCMACHGDSDPHEGQLGEQCEGCHRPVAWRELRFDHATTRFALEGQHAEADCAACHPGDRFERTPMTCVACHRVDDVHRGRLGTGCESCHAPSGWKQQGFDHRRDTRFALQGRHGELACRQCHESDPKQVTLAMDCKSCHRLDDDHHGLRGPRCENCHDARAWKPARFDHRRDTKYRLEGSHSEVACDLCHVTQMYAKATPTGCSDCHASVDVHDGALGVDCGSCHSPKGWTGRIRFDHGLTKFPLLALHQLASCEDCHVTQRYSDTEGVCSACHARQDVHEARLGARCAKCHNPNGWDRWLFDHDRQTEFALRGAHQKLECTACHHRAVRAADDASALELATSCRSCHLRDAPHGDAYGRDCERCHVDTSWKEIEGSFQ